MNGRKLSAILFFIIIILMPLVSIVSSKNKEEFPKNILNSNYSNELQNYIKEKLIFKNQINTLKSYIELMIGKKEIEEVYITKTHLLENLQYDDTHNKYINQNLKYVKSISENVNIPVNFMIIPSSLEIYKDKSLSLAPIINQKSIIDNIYKSTGDKISNIDVLSPLMSAKSQYIYYKTDSHLTSLGSFYCYNELIKNQNELPVNINKFNIQHATYDFYGSIYNKILFDDLGADRIDLYYYPEGANKFEVTKYNKSQLPQKYNNIFFKKQLEGQNKYNVFLGEQSPVTKIKTNRNNGKKLLMFKDSFADSMIQFLVNNYEEIVLFDLYNMDFDINQYIDFSYFNQISFVFGIENFINQYINFS